MASSDLVRIIDNTTIIPGDVLYIDPQNTQFPDDVLYSVHLEINDSNLGKLEYNTMYEETYASDNDGPVFIPSDGTSPDLKGELLDEITITLYQRPPNTHIIKPKKTTVNTIQTWKIPEEYDINNEYVYEWEIINLNPNITIAEVVGPNNLKEVDIKILRRGLMFLKCNIYREIKDGLLGCAKTPRIMQEVGLDLDTFAVSTNRSNN